MAGFHRVLRFFVAVKKNKTKNRGRLGVGLLGHATVSRFSLLHGGRRIVRKGKGACGDSVRISSSGHLRGGDRQGQADHQRGYAGEAALELCFAAVFILFSFLHH